MTVLKSALCASALALSASAHADVGIDVHDAAKIQSVLSGIPVVSRETGRMTLAERLASLGVTVTYLNFGKFDPDEIQNSHGDLKAADVDYAFYTTEPGGVTARCPVSTMFHLIKRGKSWLPYDRTANFYTFNVCKAPG